VVRASRLLRSERPSVLIGLLVAGLAVVAITALIYPLREISPVESNGRDPDDRDEPLSPSRETLTGTSTASVCVASGCGCSLVLGIE
jgi:hypothetical protein